MLCITCGIFYLSQYSISISLKNLLKSKIFWRFEGVWKWNIRLKWVSKESKAQSLKIIHQVPAHNWAAVKKAYNLVTSCYKQRHRVKQIHELWLELKSIHCTKKWSFSLRISWVNVTNSAGNCGFGHIYSRNP